MQLNMNKNGQTIIEAIVVIGIVVLMVTGLIAGTTVSLKTARNGQSKSKAVTFADEGIQIVRALRDSDWTGFYQRNGSYCLGSGKTLTGPTTDCPADITANGISYTRTAVMSPQPDGSMHVTVSVNAADGSLAQPVVLTTYFTNWK